ncbi:DUF1214 domain-containing protein [Nocardioides sp. CN2-186]|uniref:DUF1214 domain-containing protein n=1 Tax=Nocardioides tweenelious TaxID=3156607 RepID=UPI0032B437D1
MTTATEEAWAFLRSVLDDLAQVVRDDARDEREQLEGFRVLARILALCSELSVDVDPGEPRMFPMATPMRQVGGPNPNGEYDLCAIAPGSAYRLTGQRGSVTYLGFQVMAGVGLTPRRSAAYVSDTDLVIDADGRFDLVLAATDPGVGGQWIEIPEDASAIVVRQYVADRAVETLATYDIARLDPAGPPEALDDETLAGQLTALAWTAVKLMTLHRSIAPELLHEEPNRLITAEAAAFGAENTTPDNLYMMGVFDLADDELLQLDLTPPDTRYWSIALENVWHECLEPRRRRSSLTNASVTTEPDGTVRLLVGAQDPGHPNWLDTGGRHRGFMVLRWLDNPEAPAVATRVVRSDTL